MENATTNKRCVDCVHEDLHHGGYHDRFVLHDKRACRVFTHNGLSNSRIVVAVCSGRVLRVKLHVGKIRFGDLDISP